MRNREMFFNPAEWWWGGRKEMNAEMRRKIE